MSSAFETNPFAQDANASAQSRQELQAKLNGLGGLNGRKLSPEAKEKKLREACEGFESIFIQKMWQEMRNTVPKGGLLHGNEERFWQDMYDQELSKSMTRAGGIGLADMMFEQLSRNLVSASRGSVGQSTGGAFTPGAAPLINSSEEDLLADKNPVQVQPAASIYDGEAPQMAESEIDEPVAARDNVGELLGKAAAANLQTAAVMASQAEIAAQNAAKSVERAPKTKTLKAHTPDESSGLHLAYLARRDAGDKLGSNAVRPALHSRKQKSVKNEADVQQGAENAISGMTAQADMLKQGSPEALRAAMEKAKSGNSGLSGDNSQNLHNIVASIQAQNAMNSMNPAPVQNVSAAEESGENPVAGAHTTKVRYTTNIPQKGKNSKTPKNNDVIRMLNVENVGVNSKAGQGLAAYHAAQEAVKTQTTGQAADTSKEKLADNASAIAPISPLTAQSLRTDDTQGESNFAIPPLKAKDLRG